MLARSAVIRTCTLVRTCTNSMNKCNNNKKCNITLACITILKDLRVGITTTHACTIAR